MGTGILPQEHRGQMLLQCMQFLEYSWLVCYTGETARWIKVPLCLKVDDSQAML